MSDPLERYSRFLHHSQLVLDSNSQHQSVTVDLLKWQLSPLRGGQISDKAARRLERQLLPRLLAAQLKGPDEVIPVVNSEEGIFWGNSAQTGEPLYLHRDWLTGHVVMPGITGSGKTTALVTLSDELMRHHVPVEMIDFKEGGRFMRRFPEAVMFRPDQEYVNYLDPIGPPDQYYAAIAPELVRGIGVRSDSTNAMFDTLLRAHAARRPGEPAISLSQLEKILRHRAKSEGPRFETLANAVAIFAKFLGPVARVRRAPPWENRFRFIIHNMANVPPTYRACLSAMRLLRIQALAAEQGHTHHLQRAILRDEAGLEHGREFEAQTGSGFITAEKRWITQMRSRGVAIISPCQIYSQMAEDLKANCNIINAFQTVADVAELRERLQLSDQDIVRLQNLPRGHAFVHAQGFSRAIEVYFPNVDLGLYPPEEEVANKMEPLLSSIRKEVEFSPEERVKPLEIHKILGQDEASVPREPDPTVADALAGSDSKALEELQHKMLGDHWAFLCDVADHPDGGIAERFKRLGFGGAKGNRIKKDLLKLALLVVESHKSQIGAPTKTLRLTDKAKVLLASRNP